MTDPEFTFRILGSGGLVEIISQKEPPAHLTVAISIALILFAIRLPVASTSATVLRLLKNAVSKYLKKRP
jgi:hypothetical protein